MEHKLRIAGRVFAVVYAIFAVVLLVFSVVSTSMLRGLAATPLAIGQTLNEAGFREEVAPAILTALVDRLPDTLTVGNVTIQMSELTAPLLSSDAATISETILSPQWLQAQAASMVFGAVDRAQTAVANEVDLLRDRFEGQPAFELAQVVLSAVRVCSDTEEQRLEQAAESGSYEAIDFICNPSTAPEGLVRSTMRDFIIVLLGQLGSLLSERLQAEMANFDLSQIVIDTPLGPARLEWPNIVVGQGLFSVTVPIPEQIAVRIQEGATNVQSRVQTAVAQGQNVVSTSQANVDSMATQVASAAETFSAPTITPSPRPTITPIPTIAPENRPINVVGNELQNVLVELDTALTQVANNLTTVIWIVIGFLLLNMLIIILFALRTWPGLILWAGAALLAAGLIVLIFGGRLGGRFALNEEVTASTDEPVAVAELKATIEEALSESFSAELSAPLRTQGAVMLVVGAVLLGGGLYLARRKPSAPPPTSGELIPIIPYDPTPDSPPALAVPAKTETPPAAEKPATSGSDEQKEEKSDEPPPDVEDGAAL